MLDREKGPKGLQRIIVNLKCQSSKFEIKVKDEVEDEVEVKVKRIKS
jgi:hypothetical protein